MKRREIILQGVRVHNLKNISVNIPKNQLVVFTGVSGSGKSSLAFDTIYAEGHRQYVESLSSYARQFLARTPKPDVDTISGLAPAIAIEQKVHSGNVRSTIATATELYEYLRLLFARAGRTISPVSNQEVQSDTVSDVVEYIMKQPTGTKIILTSKITISHKTIIQKELQTLLQKGFTRVFYNNNPIEIESVLSGAEKVTSKKLELLIDRFIVRENIDEAEQNRISDSVQIAFTEGNGYCSLWIDKDTIQFSENFERDGIVFERPTPQLFNFNNSYGACRKCEGTGTITDFSPELVFRKKYLSITDNCIHPWTSVFVSKAVKNLYRDFLAAAPIFKVRTNVPYALLSQEEKNLLWFGNNKLPGLYPFLKGEYPEVRCSNPNIYKGPTACPECSGFRLRKEANYVFVGNYCMKDLLALTIDQLSEAFEQIPQQLREHELNLSTRLLHEITTRLAYLRQVGVGYLQVSRPMNTLSGGETQRIHLATYLGSNLTGAMYILDEPSVGLHPRDANNLIEILKRLRNQGNSVIVVEHDEATIRNADFILDFGPKAGELGGQVVAQGNLQTLLNTSESLTAQYLNRKLQIPIPVTYRKPIGWINLTNVLEHNLKGINVSFPLGVLTVVTGVSGSGKSTLVRTVLTHALTTTPVKTNYVSQSTPIYESVSGDFQLLKAVEVVDQSPIGRSSRSNPVTYIEAFEAIRELFANQPDSKKKRLSPGFFSFNIAGGRCESCEGEGEILIPMQFLPDVKITCEACKGKRFSQNVLEINYKGKNIADVLDMTVSEAIQHFKNVPKIVNRLQKLEDVGLGYIRLGQSSSTLSGGEAQRVKLAAFLSRSNSEKNSLLIFDEPTTGLHFYDVDILLQVFNQLIEAGNTIIVIEHNLEVIKCADWIIDLGPEGGANGGYLVYAGTPDKILQQKNSLTATFLAQRLKETVINQ
ncbi:MAG: excinuclease ABC subunit UvrA [Bacteroidia bacterium]|nr:excinuclease ABC subunit UvrA [Bacteroidia bacterium]